MRSQRLRTAFFRSRRRHAAPSEPGRIAAKSPSPATAREGVAPSKPCRLKVAREGLRRVPLGANGNFFRYPGFNQPTGGRRPTNGVPCPGPTARRSRTAEGAGGAVARRQRTCPESAQAARRRSHRCAAHPSENRGATSLANSVMLFAVVSKSMSPECSMAMRWPNPPIFSYSASIWRATPSGVP